MNEVDINILLDDTEYHNREWCTCPSCEELRRRGWGEAGEHQEVGKDE